MKLPSVKDLPVRGKRVFLRTNYDVPLRLRSGQAPQVADDTRIVESLPTLNLLLAKKARVVIVSHLGRPAGKKVHRLSLEPVAEYLGKLLSRRIRLVNRVDQVNQEVVMLENLRFWPQEEANPSTNSGLEFAKKLASLADFYVNEAFACSHRQHASIVGVPRLFPAPPSAGRALGLDFLEEIKMLSWVKKNPKRPVVLILGGIKKDKIEIAKKLIPWADWILIGGKLVEYDGIPQLISHTKIIGSLIKNEQDITMETIKKFKSIIAKSKTIVWSGPLGNFWDKRYVQGTEEIAKAVVKSGAFTVAGGGDTEVALTKFGLVDKINYISSGGGAMLEFLASGTLPGIEAIIHG